jgi:hypothetical protein
MEFSLGDEMKLKVIFLLLALSCTLTICAQTTVKNKVGNSLADRNDAKAQLQLTTSILKQMYCSPEHIGFSLKLVFRNIGREPIILNKKYLLGSVVVSRDLRAAAAKQYETYIRYEIFGSNEPGFGLDLPTISDFMILTPGESYEFEDNVSVLTNNVTPPAEGYLHPGTHFLQIGVGTWPYIADSKPYRKKWKGKGYLWSQGLISLPLPFIVEKNPLISPC